MVDKDTIKRLPMRRIEPIDGMAVTAQVWQEAHDYHRSQQQMHDVLRHSPAILAGLGVIASDPPDSSIYVLPGVAVDSLGRTIVVTEPVAFDLGGAHGLVHLLLTYEESPPTADATDGDGPLYIQSQFGVEVAATLADSQGLELARVRRRDRESAIKDAKDGQHPQGDELDLRFRLEVDPRVRKPVSVGVYYTGGAVEDGQAHGADSLARYLRHAERPVWVDDRIRLTEPLAGYTLLYLVGHDAFQLDREEMNAMYSFLQAGGTVVFESCRREGDDGEPAADASFLDLAGSMGIQLVELAPDDDLLVQPHQFAAPPPGFEAGDTGRVLAGQGIVFSGADYGCLWQGRRRDRLASREEIRSGLEWGSNLLAYALARQAETR
jgi:hypothetical protein